MFPSRVVELLGRNAAAAAINTYPVCRVVVGSLLGDREIDPAQQVSLSDFRIALMRYPN